MTEVIETLGPWTPLIVFVAAYFETAAFLGIVVPGETIMLAGGAAAGASGTSIGVIIIAAVVGAAMGDATGYFLGRRYGAALLERKYFQRFAEPVDRAGSFLERNGWWALILARFMAMFRAVVPFAAGAARMPYRRFAIGNVTGSILYGGTIAGFGYWAGTRWEQMREIVSRGGIALGVVIATVLAIYFTTRWMARNRVRVERRLAAWARLPWLGRLLRLAVTRAGRARPYLGVLPHLGLGAAMVTLFAITGLVDWSFVEARLIEWIQTVDPAFVAIAADVSEAHSSPWLLAILAAAALSFGPLVSWRAMALAVAAPATTLVLTELFVGQIDRPFGPVDLELALPPNFPDGATAMATATLIALAWPWTGSWRARVTRLGAAITMIAIFGMARTVAVASYPIDVLAGGSMALAITVWMGLAIDPRLSSKLRAIPNPRDDRAQMPAPAAPAPERPDQV